MDKLTAMRIFKEVAKQGSFSQAADNLNISRAKATRYISDLEKWLNCRLFNRSTRNLSLTLAGESHLAKAEQILDLTDSFKQSSSLTTEEPQGKIRVSSSIAFSEAHLAKALVRYLELFPKVSVELITGEPCINLIDSRVDLAIRTHIEPANNLIARPICTTKAILCASPDYLKSHSQILSPYDLPMHDIALCTSFKPFDKWLLSKSGEKITIDLKSRLFTDDILSLSKAAIAGGGIVRLPHFLAEPLIDEGKLQRVLPDWALFDLKIWVVYSSREHLPATVRSLIDFLADYFDSLDNKKGLKSVYER